MKSLGMLLLVVVLPVSREGRHIQLFKTEFLFVILFIGEKSASRPGPLKLSAAATSNTAPAASAEEDDGNGISGKGGRTSRATAIITEQGAEHGTDLSGGWSNQNNNQRRGQGGKRLGVEGSSLGLGSGQSRRRKQQGVETRAERKQQVGSSSAGGEVEEGGGSGGFVDGVCGGSGESGGGKDFSWRVVVEEDAFPWKYLSKERCSKVVSTRSRFCEPCALPSDVDLWPLKMARDTTPITAFFRNRSVFVTGATGFLGKAAVEKLLRTCPEVQTVYVLIRPKSGSDVQARLEELLENSVSFEQLKG